GDIVPEPAHRLSQRLLSGFETDVGDTCGEIHLPNRMAGGRLYLSNGNVILMILRPVGPEAPHLALAALVDKELRQAQIPALVRTTVEFDQRHLNFWVSARALALVRAKDAVDMVGQPARDLEQPSIAQRPL